ncbi:selenoprotein S [Sceloporus undulatus]|uniref:selenoprotein S n=1 Tax=Sceloporus undulatus TaxID=8520 RepID=UPI001C4D542C|nr:selenoprotein S [Sceloporus undulatus]
MAAGMRPEVEEEGAHSLLETVGSLLSDYGWYILFSLIVVYLLVQKLAKSYRGTRRPCVDTAAIEPDAVVKRQEALLAARLRMQEELNAQAEKFKEKQKKQLSCYNPLSGEGGGTCSWRPGRRGPSAGG